ncbi:MAG TPA: hypothetical protein VIL85_16190 [Thermomicrobiales bacterium]|jgi:hypothetical protein
MRAPIAQFLAILALCLGLLAPAGVVSAAGGNDNGNGDNAAACQQGGYAQYLGLRDGQVVTFANAGECANFAAHGGTLIARQAALPCLDGGYTNWARQNGTTFGSEADCVAYVGVGGVLAPKVGYTVRTARIIPDTPYPPTDPAWATSFPVSTTYAVLFAVDLCGAVNPASTALELFMPGGFPYIREPLAGPQSGMVTPGGPIACGDQVGQRYWVSLPVAGTAIEQYLITGDWEAKVIDQWGQVVAVTTFTILP